MYDLFLRRSTKLKNYHVSKPEGQSAAASENESDNASALVASSNGTGGSLVWRIQRLAWKLWRGQGS